MRPPDPRVGVQRYEHGAWTAAEDRVAAEEPLQVRLDGRDLAVVMRTPGDDVELALGLLFAEGVIGSLAAVRRVLVSAEAGARCEPVPLEAALLESNTVDVRVRRAGRRPRRTFLSSSACGVCGATTIDDVAARLRPLPPAPGLDPELVAGLPERLREGQELFARTGGLHAAGAFTAGGSPIALREDVGRHNALDKVVGRLLLDAALPATGLLLAVSGRAGYELVQKAIAAGFCALVAVGAPSSLAVALADRFGLVLAGFTRGGRFNVYAGAKSLQVRSSSRRGRRLASIS